MKVVQINAVNRSGSTGSNTNELHEFLLGKGVDSYVFCTNENYIPKNIFKIGSSISRNLHAVLSRVTGLQGYYSTTSTLRLIHNLKRINPDVILLGNLHSNFLNLPLLFGYISEQQITTVNVLHDCWTFTGHCCHYTKISCEKWKQTCDKCPLLREDNVSYIDRSKKSQWDKRKWFHGVDRLGVVGVSDWIRDEAKKSIVFPSHTRFKTIYNWIDLDLFHLVEKDVARKKLDLHHFGNYAISVSQLWIEAKGLGLILKLATEYPDTGILLVGQIEGTPDLPDNIIPTGHIADKELLALYYNASDVYLNLSKQETFGKVSAEALACGLPILSGDKTASPEVCGNCGIIVNLENTDSVFSAFNSLIHGKSGISRTECRQRAERLFNKGINLNEYYDFFVKLCVSNR